MADEKKREEAKNPCLPIHRNSEYSRMHCQTTVHQQYHRAPYYLLEPQYATRLLEDGIIGRERVHHARRATKSHRTQH